MKICKECGKELPITHRRRYCDWKCRNHYRRDRGYFKDLYASKHPEREKKKCILCGDLILFKKRGVTRKNVSKFCSKWCMQMSVRILKGQKNMYIKVPVGVKEEMIGDKGLECGYCDSQFLTTREGYIRLHLHQIIYHGDVVNDGESKVGTRIKG